MDVTGNFSHRNSNQRLRHTKGQVWTGDKYAGDVLLNVNIKKGSGNNVLI